ncbi:MAG: histidine triad nucleotide-binding protein [Spirochaetaceae bacterium]
METIFDKILSGEIDSEFVYEDDHVVAFKDINPQAPVHVLVLPRQKFVSLVEAKDLDAVQLGRFIQGISKCAAALGLEERGYRVVFNSGKEAQQTVEYVHAHILGGRRLNWPPG